MRVAFVVPHKFTPVPLQHYYVNSFTCSHKDIFPDFRRLQQHVTGRRCSIKGYSHIGTISPRDGAAEQAKDLLVIGRARLLAGDTSSSLEMFRRAADLDPRNCTAKVELGRALIACGMRMEGFESLVAAFQLDSLCPGAKDAFREYYRAEIEADPNNIDLHEGLAALCMDSGWPEEAAKSYQICLNLDSVSSSAASAAAADDDSADDGTPTRQDSGASDDDDARRARRDRWSVALFKCHASLCLWDNWDAEARALRAAVRRRGKPSGVTASAVAAAAAAAATSAEIENDDISGSYMGQLGGFVVGVAGEEEEDEEAGIEDGEGRLLKFPCAEAGSGDNRSTADNGITAGSEGGGRECEGPVVATSRPALHPFDSLSAPLTIGDCLAVAQQQSRGVRAAAEEAATESSVRCGEDQGIVREGSVRWQRRTSSNSDCRLRLGYVSGDLMGSHPLTHLMQSTFGMHDRRKLEVFLYALNPSDGSAARRRMEDEAEHFQDLSKLTAVEAAEVISADGISVLVNLNGYAGAARSADIFALRPAAIAVSYMGFPGSMGCRDMVDYILADGVVIPSEMRRYYSEKVLKMPHCYFVNDYRQSGLAAITSPAPIRSDYGLPPGGDEDSHGQEAMAGDRWWGDDYDDDDDDGDDGDGRERIGGGRGAGEQHTNKAASAGAGGEGDCVVLCNFNRLHKIDPHTFDAWMEILRNVPRTVLWLLDGGETACANLRRRARLAGVDDTRLFFAPLVDKEAHLRRLRLADLFLDTPLYNAHTVGCDALWTGVPMVTLRGERMASRVGASLVRAAGFPELVTDTMQGYTRLAQELASDDRRRRSVRRKLQGVRFTCPLFDTQQWVTNAEEGFCLVWARHQADLPPAHVSVGEVPSTWQ